MDKIFEVNSDLHYIMNLIDDSKKKYDEEIIAEEKIKKGRIQ